MGTDRLSFQIGTRAVAREKPTAKLMIWRNGYYP